WEVLPTTAWNYGLELDGKNPIKSLELHRKAGTLPENPFKPETVPIEIKAKARKIAGWQQDKLGLVGKLQPSPAKSDEPVETISLIPMGAARLRISSFPTIGHGNDAHEWSSSAALPIIASHCFSGDSVEAMVDGIEPKSSSDATIPRFTWWDHRGTAEWVEWGFAKRRQISAVEIYWFDDTGKGSCRAPQSWKLFYRVGEAWKPVENSSEFGTKLDTYNRLSFNSVDAEGLRLEVQLQPEFSGGILEWKVRE
ncbi:MAG TPA: transcriptional initiation protein Tat, partial [Verrucomicrobiae bacterium]